MQARLGHESALRWVHLALAAAALALVVSAALVELWPLSANGVTGSAVSPAYHDFGFFSSGPIPRNATPADLRRAGVRLPQDVVHHRQHIALGLGSGGALAVVVLGLLDVTRLRSGALRGGSTSRRVRSSAGEPHPAR